MGDPQLNKTAGWVTRANKKPEGKMAPEKTAKKAAKQQPAKTGDLTKSARKLSAYQNDRAFGHTTPASGKYEISWRGSTRANLFTSISLW